MIVLTRANGSECPTHFKMLDGLGLERSFTALQVVLGSACIDNVEQCGRQIMHTHSAAFKMGTEECHFTSSRSSAWQTTFADAFHNRNAY